MDGLYVRSRLWMHGLFASTNFEQMYGWIIYYVKFKIDACMDYLQVQILNGWMDG